MGAVSVIAGMQGALPPHRCSLHEITGPFIRFPRFAAFNDMVWKLHASSKVLESIRATALLALSPPSGNTAPLGARKPDGGAEPRAGPGFQVVSSGPSASAIPSVPALESKKPAIPPACRP